MTRSEYLEYHAAAIPGLFAQENQNNLGSLANAVPALGARLQAYEDDGAVYRGKVRDRLSLGNKVLLFTSDRISAFDVVLGLVPCKGEVLNRLSDFWFNHCSDILPNHRIELVGGRGMLCKAAQVLPLEVVVRGYLTGSAWRDYQAGRSISGIQLEPGLKKDQKFPKPIITPSTKEELGKHDEAISREDLLARGLVAPELWAHIERAALALFARGTEICARQGLILVDTKYEFGLVDGRLTLVDEVHTPDSSRFWYSDTYTELFEKGEEQRRLDKEYLRSWLIENKWQGHGPVPNIPSEVFLELGWRYVQAFQEISGEEFTVFSPNMHVEAANILSIL